MKAFLTISVIILLLGLGGVGYLYWQQQDKLATAQAQSAGYLADNSALQAELTARQAEVDALQARLTTATTQAQALQAELTAAKAAAAQLAAELAGCTSDTSALIAAQGRVSLLEADLAAANTRASAAETALASANTALAAVQANLDAANAVNSSLRATVTAQANELRKIKDPAHFTTLDELTAWLAADDTDTNPAFDGMSPTERALVLQIKALRKGYLLPAAIDADSSYVYSWNTAIIAGTIYVVNAGTDQAVPIAVLDRALPEHPLPLP